MSRITKIVWVLGFSTMWLANVNGQTNYLADIVPPTPNASAFHVYGNTQVNHYTGAPIISIPIWEIKEGDLTLPIILKYTGGNGIKVEEVASWVGLGWTLNYGGAISRVQRGKVDEDPNYGYLHSDFPSSEVDSDGYFEDALEWMEIFRENRDVEPDLFLYNYPEGVGQFFVKKDGNTLLKPRKNINIRYENAPVSTEERINIIESIPTNGKLGKFSITSESGRIYEFDERERNFSYSTQQDLTDKRSFPSSWLLTKIKSQKTEDRILLEYETYNYENIRRISVLVKKNAVQSIEEDHYLRAFMVGKRIKTIRFSEGTISFIASATNRQDLKRDKSLKEILIKDINGRLIKRLAFNYKYLTSKGLVDEQMVTEFSNKNRLMLHSITEYDKHNQAKPSYQFTYNATHILPARDSKSQDHWGYFNGQRNSKLLSKHRIHVFNRSKFVWENKIFGTADRTVSTVHEQAGILTQIQYPTGGKTEFAYESHTANNENLPGIIYSKAISLDFPNIKHTFSVELGAEPFSEVKIKALFLDNTVHKCFPVYHIKNLSTGQVKIIHHSSYDENTDIEDTSFTNSPPIINSFPKAYLEKGNYEVWFTLESNVSNDCNMQDPFPIRFSWENERATKLVGGVRIKKTVHINGDEKIAKEYSYILPGEVSSGVLNSIPKYFFHVQESYFKMDDVTTQGELKWYQKEPNGLIHHSIESFYPLVNSQESHIGYEKVTVAQLDNKNGKTEYYYTTYKDYPDTFERKVMDFDLRKEGEGGAAKYVPYFNGLIYENHFKLFMGKKIDAYPIVPVDSKSFLRGLPKKEIQYKKDNDTFKMISKVEYEYNSLFFSRAPSPIGIGKLDDISEKEENFITGMAKVRVFAGFVDSYNNNVVRKFVTSLSHYDFFTGYTVPTKITSTSYFGGKELSTVTEKTYHKDNEYNLFVKWFNPKASITKNSAGETLLNKYFYAYDLNDLTLLNQNRINELLKLKTYKAGNILSETNTIYNWFEGNYLPKGIQSSKGNNPLETVLTFHRYDSAANPLEVSQKDGMHRVYLYGYSKQYPIAQIENATFSEVAQALGISETTLENFNENHVGQINGLRAQKPEWMITTYTHIPLVGIKTVTDPRGRRTNYEYDDFNRLKHIKDHNGDILEAYDYNYKNE